MNRLNRYIKRVIFCISSLLFCCTLSAQQDLMMSQQLFSRINVNPAGTGNNDKFDLFVLGRFQWVGVDNGPKTGLLNFSGYSEKLKSSLGLSVYHDHLGIGHSTTNAQIVYSYHLDLSEKYILSMGISGGVNFGYFNPADNTMRDEVEYGMETYVQDKTTEITPDINLGFELTSKIWMVGISCTHLLNDSSTTFKSGRHFYLYGRALLPISSHFDIAPALSYMHKGKINNIEVNAMLFYNKFIWGGVTWKPDLSNPAEMSLLAFTAGFEWNKYRIGYTYNMNLGRCNNLPSNTHDILLSMQF